MAVLLIGYDVEVMDSEKNTTERFITTASRVHEELDAPCSIFVCGRTAQMFPDAIRMATRNKLFDIQQHTYSHVRLKTLVQENENGITVLPGAESVEQIEDEIRRANEVLRELFGIRCIGMTAPYGYYRGLSDRIDILKILSKNGIKFVRSWLRNEKDWVPLSLTVQPFTYASQGFDEILELPVQAWHDVNWRFYGSRSQAEYIAVLRKQIDHVVENDYVWGYLQHDYTTEKYDPEMRVVRELVRYAKVSDVEVMSCKDYYDLYFAKNYE